MYKVIEKVYEKDLVIVNEMPQEDLIIILTMYHNRTIHQRLEKIGEGEFGRVYVYKALSGKEYAIKIEKEMHEKIYESNTYDTTILSKIQGIKYIPKLYAYIGEDFMIVDRVKGVTLEEYKAGKTNNVYPSDNFVSVFENTIDNILKRKIKPSDLHYKNIMINEEGLPIMIDFGHWHDYTDNTRTPSKAGLKYKILDMKDFYEAYNPKAKEEKEKERKEFLDKLKSSMFIAI